MKLVPDSFGGQPRSVRLLFVLLCFGIAWTLLGVILIAIILVAA
jgi:phage shock protein PspC (stress-responsive transcriptional regulator)